KVSGLVAARMRTIAIAIATVIAIMTTISNIAGSVFAFPTISAQGEPQTVIRRKPQSLWSGLRAARRAVTHQTIEMHPNVRGFGGRIGERDGAVERHVGFLAAAELHKERAAYAEVMEIIRKRQGQRFDHFECCLRAAKLGHRDRSVERHHRRWLDD